MIILIAAGSLSLVFIAIALLIWPGKQYWLVAGYNVAPPEIQAKYDIEALAKHLSFSLVYLATLMMLCVTLFLLGYPLASGVFGAIFIFLPVWIICKGQGFVPSEERIKTKLLKFLSKE